MKRLYRVLSVALLGLAFAASAASASDDRIFQAVAQAWSQRDYQGVFAQADSWLQGLEDGSVPAMGPNYEQIAFLVGYSGYKLVEDGALALGAEEYERKVVNPLQRAIEVSKRDFTSRVTIVSRAYKTLYDLQEPKSQDVENQTVWLMWRAVIEQQKIDQWQRPVSEKTAAFLYQYVEFCMDMVETTEYPDLYRYRIRNACQLGLGVSPNYDSAFWLFYEMTFFDEGNILAGVLKQKAYDFLYVEDPDAIREFNALMKRAIDISNTNKAKAELYRQLADNLATVGGERFEEEANVHARAAYNLMPFDKDIRDLYGSTLFTLSQKAFREKNYMKAMKHSEQGTKFVNAFDYEHYMTLARVQAFQGMMIDAIRNARTAYQKACLQASASDISFFADTYKTVLEQFGQGDKFKPCTGKR